MGVEIERKFLLANDAWRAAVTRRAKMQQGYLSTARDCTVRVRLEGDAARLTIKGATHGIERAEFEYPIPVTDAKQLLDSLCGGRTLAKTRHYVEVGTHCWEIDEFHGANQGLVVAELELAAAEEAFERPAWLGDEVSDDARYYNSVLIQRPFTTWDGSS